MDMDVEQAIKVLADRGGGTYGRVYAAEAALVRELDAARARVAALEAENAELRAALNLAVDNTAKARRELAQERTDR
jgi:cell division protein FtsB